MQLYAFTFAILAICSADRLERTYLPPAGANTAGGSDGALSAPSGSSFAGHHNQSPHGSQPQAFEPQTYSTRPQSSGSQPQSFEPQTYSARPQSSPGSQTQSFRPQSQSFGPQSQSGPNGPPNANSNFGPSNSRYQPTNERPQSNYQQNSQGPQYSQGSDFGPDSSSSGRGTFNGSPNPNINYDTPNNDYQSGNGNSNGNYQTKSQRPQASAEANAAILRSESNIDGDSFSYSYETENGISADESGIATNGVQAQGSYSYTGDDGQLYSITYTADENGYRPVGDHLPTPPPIPDAILRSIEENARAAAANPGGNYGDQSNSDNQNYNGIGSSTGTQNRPSGNRYQGSSQGPSEDESTGYGPPTNRSPAHQQLNRQQTYNNNGPRDFEAPNGNGNNNQYNSPSRPAGQSRFPGGQPQTYTNDAYKNGPQQDSYDANTQQGPAETGYPSGRPSNQGFTGVSNDQQSGQRRPPASFNPDSGYKY